MQVEDKRWRLFTPIFTTGSRLSTTVHMKEEEILMKLNIWLWYPAYTKHCREEQTM
jgi:hypothetical protein